MWYFFSLLEEPEEGREGAVVEAASSNAKQMIQDSGDLREQNSNKLSSFRDDDVEEALDGDGEALLVRHHRDVVESVHVRPGLKISLVLDQLLGGAVQQPDVAVGAPHRLALHLQNESVKREGRCCDCELRIIRILGSGQFWSPEVNSGHSVTFKSLVILR